MKFSFLYFAFCILLAGCAVVNAQSTGTPPAVLPTAVPTMSTLPNPASVYCEQQGYKLEIRTADDGSQAGYCLFPGGSECDEWAFYRGECQPGGSGGSLPNPASVYCDQQGYSLEIRTADDGSQAGVCVFPDGSECDEWAYYRGECSPAGDAGSGESSDVDSLAWKTFTNPGLGYTFIYPAQAEVITNDEPLGILYVSGTGMGTESWMISHPGDRDEYRPPEDADLLQWLTDHNLLGENRQPDIQIAGTTAIHFRHERSPQSYADDRYFFAHQGQLFMIIIGHSGDAEDWELNNRFLQSFQFEDAAANLPATTTIPTAVPIDPSYYQGFWTYVHPQGGFSIMLPEDWVVEETTVWDPLMNGHMLILHPQPSRDIDLQIRMTFRPVGDEVLLWPTGVGAGEFISGGTLDVAGAPARRTYLVCSNGQIESIWYQGSEGEPNIIRNNMEFAFIYSYTGTSCQQGYDLTGKVQLTGELIIASLQVQ